MSDENGVQEVFSGPYRATKLWNSIIYAFRSKMPLKKHRRQMRLIDNCFSATNAIDWLHDYLRQDPNFGPDVTRYQAIQLLKKLKECNIFESVHIYKRQLHSDDFQDNRDLYRFVNRSPLKPTYCYPGHSTSHIGANSSGNTVSNDGLITEPKQNCEETIPECRVVSRHLTTSEIENTWKAATLGKLQAALNLESLEGILDFNVVNPKSIIHNMTRIMPEGVVAPLNRSEELPHWLKSAMKCLMSWPKASGEESCLPKYLGFEKDVFKVVRDHFENLETPLIPFELYSLLIVALVSSNRLQHEPSLTMTTSMEDLVSRMANAWTSAPYNKHKTLKGEERRRSSCLDLPGRLQGNVSNNSLQSSNKVLSIPCFETAFLTADPVTRMIPQMICSSNDATNLLKPHYSLSSLNTHGKIQNTHLPKFVSADDLLFKKENCQVKKAISNQISPNPDDLLVKEDRFNSTGSQDDEVFDEDLAEVWCTAQKLIGIPDGESVSSESSYYSADSFHSRQAERLITAPTKHPLKDCEGLDRSYIISDFPAPQPGDENNTIYQSVQLSLLLLPPDSRRKLHLLLRFMHKISINDELQLEPNSSNRKVVLKIFTRNILRSYLEADYDEQLAFQLVTFLMDNHEAVLTIPSDLKAQVDDRLIVMQKCQIKYLPDCDASTITYCEQVTKEEYERQRLSMSGQALADLLNSIITDPHLSKREKRKKLKQFKKMYPEIYTQKFPNTNATTPLFSKSLQKLRGLRM